MLKGIVVPLTPGITDEFTTNTIFLVQP